MHYSTHLLRHVRQTIGFRIHQQRRKKRLTLRKLARLTAINEARLDQLELGKSEIRIDELLKIICVLKISLPSTMEL
jgi:transcriptional regulator with XRE-family HTH domain